MRLEMVSHLFQARHFAVNQIVCQMHEEGFVTDGGLSAQDGVP